MESQNWKTTKHFAICSLHCGLLEIYSIIQTYVLDFFCFWLFLLLYFIFTQFLCCFAAFFIKNQVFFRCEDEQVPEKMVCFILIGLKGHSGRKFFFTVFSQKILTSEDYLHQIWAFYDFPFPRYNRLDFSLERLFLLRNFARVAN